MEGLRRMPRGPVCGAGMYPHPSTPGRRPRPHHCLQLRITQQPALHAVVQRGAEGGGRQRHRGQGRGLHQRICRHGDTCARLGDPPNRNTHRAQGKGRMQAAAARAQEEEALKTPTRPLRMPRPAPLSPGCPIIWGYIWRTCSERYSAYVWPSSFSSVPCRGARQRGMRSSQPWWACNLRAAPLPQRSHINFPPMPPF